MILVVNYITKRGIYDGIEVNIPHNKLEDALPDIVNAVIHDSKLIKEAAEITEAFITE